MTQKIGITGMMCAHCEAHMKKALETLGVTVQKVSHDENCAVIETAAPLAEDVLKDVVAKAGYTFTGVE